MVSSTAIEPAAPGLDLICRGLRLTSPDDRTAVERGELIYDALFIPALHWAKRESFQGTLEAEDQRFILEATQDIMERLQELHGL